MEDAEPVVEVLAEPALARAARVRSRFVAAMTRTSTCDVSRAADAPDLAALERAEELRLDGERHLADLVEEERAAVAPASKQPGLSAIGAGERAALVAEELALEQGLGDRGSSSRSTNGRCARRLCRWIARRDQLLAGAALARDEHGALGRRDLRDQPEDPLHARAHPDHALGDPAAPGRLVRRGLAPPRDRATTGSSDASSAELAPWPSRRRSRRLLRPTVRSERSAMAFIRSSGLQLGELDTDASSVSGSCVLAALAPIPFLGDLRVRHGTCSRSGALAHVAYLAAAWAWRATRRPPDIAARSRRTALVVLGVAALARDRSSLPAQPTLSEDVYRYLWDGRLGRAGVNPYSTPRPIPRSRRP